MIVDVWVTSLIVLGLFRRKYRDPANNSSGSLWNALIRVSFKAFKMRNIFSIHVNLPDRQSYKLALDRTPGFFFILNYTIVVYSGI